MGDTANWCDECLTYLDYVKGRILLLRYFQEIIYNYSQLILNCQIEHRVMMQRQWRRKPFIPNDISRGRGRGKNIESV